jgi:hypothetical protein
MMAVCVLLIADSRGELHADGALSPGSIPL